jgi:hypothetical protein
MKTYRITSVKLTMKSNIKNMLIFLCHIVTYMSMATIFKGYHINLTDIGLMT